MRMRILPLAGLLVFSSAASAAGYSLQTLSPETLVQLRSFAERGELVLIESNRGGTLKQITLMTVVRAPRQIVWDVLSATERYPDFVPNVVRSKTIVQRDHERVVSWELEVPLINVEGKNRYRFSPPQAMDVDAVSGDLKTGAWRWELYPLGDDATLAVEYAYSDIRNLNRIIRWMIRGNMTLEHGLVLSAATVFIKALKQRAESIAGRGPAGRPDPKEQRKIVLRSLRADSNGSLLRFDALAPLLDRGTLALVQSFPDGRLHQAVLMTRAYVPRNLVYDVAAHPENYDEFMSGIPQARALRDDGKDLLYEMEVEAPLLNIQFKAHMIRGPDWLWVDTVGGDLRNAHFAWEFLPQGQKRTLMLYYTNSDLRRNSWVVRQLINREPYFEHGVNVATGLITLGVVRGRAEGWVPTKNR